MRCADNLHTSTQTSLEYPHHPTQACYSPTSSITVVATVPTELLAEQVYNPLSLEVA